MSINGRHRIVFARTLGTISFIPYMLVLVCISLGHANVDAQERMAQIIQNVRCNEDLYKNLEVEWSENYELSKGVVLNQKDLIESSSRVCRSILQKEFIYL